MPEDARGGSEDAHRAAFAKALLEALRDAEEAAQRPRSADELAQKAWDALQFDFPIVSAEELRALADLYAAGRAPPLTRQLLAAAREGAAPAAAAPAAAASEAAGVADASGGAAAELQPLYQQLYGLALVSALDVGLAAVGSAGAAASDVAAASLLAQHELSEAEKAAEYELSKLAEDGGEPAAGDDASSAGAAIPLQHQPAARQDADGERYEPLEAPPAPAGAARRATAAAARDSAGVASSPGAGGGAPQLAAAALLHLVRHHLSYPCLSGAALWQQRRLMRRLAACLAAARRHPQFAGSAELQKVAGALVALACDRLTAAPAEVEEGLPLLLDALSTPAGEGGTASAACKTGEIAASLALGVAAALAGRLPTLSARRRLWQEAHEGLLPLAGAALEGAQVALARRARHAAAAAAEAVAAAAAPAAAVCVGAQEWEGVAAACRLLYFYVLEAPAVAAGSRLQDALLKGGAFRPLVLLFLQLGALPEAEALRCALLLSCAAAPGLLQWAAAVPGFGAALAAPAFRPGGGAALHGALWDVVRQAGGEELTVFLEEAAASPAGVPRLHQALQLMADLQAGARGRRLWLPEVEGALRALSATLRERYGKPPAGEEEGAGAASDEAATGRANGSAGPAEAEEAGARAAAAAEAAAEEAERRKLGRSAEEQAETLALRQARQLQPACLRLLKDLLHSKQGAKSD
eukprot:scaffold1.g5442.t1